ncbi:uncharacterized protein METZ01_LOCUS516568, partial [marine metagenome]
VPIAASALTSEECRLYTVGKETNNSALHLCNSNQLLSNS